MKEACRDIQCDSLRMDGARIVFVLLMYLTVASSLNNEGDFLSNMASPSSLFEDDILSQAYSIKEKFKILLEQAITENLDNDVDVYVGTHGDFYKEDLDEPVMYQDDEDYTHEKSKRGSGWHHSVPVMYQDDEDYTHEKSKRGSGWHHSVDGWEKEGDDEVFLEPQPWMLDENLGVYDAAEPDGDQAWKKRTDDSYIDVPFKRTAGELQDDFGYAESSIDDYLRRRRGMADEEGISAVVDLLVLVDNAVYRKAIEQYGQHREAVKTIKQYYSVIVSLIDIRYAEIDDPQLNIRISLSKIFIAKDRSSSPWSDYHVRRAEDNPRELVLDPSTGLNALREWLIIQTKEGLRKIDFDHAMAFTGYTLMSKKLRITTGMAYVATICQLDEGYACSIINEKGGFINVGTAVHELGHSLGAKHDGLGSNNVCPGSENYIMAPFNTGNNAVLANYFRFSQCSIRGFKNLLSTEQASCLTDSEPEEYSQNKLPGELFSPDEQCIDAFGPHSGLCPHTGIQEPEEICVRLWCLNPDGQGTCLSTAGLSALYGTPCGKYKICKQGHCVRKRVVLAKANRNRDRKLKKAKSRLYSLNTAAVPEANPHSPCAADQSREYCYRVVAQRPDSCGRSDIRKYCCYSCHYAPNGDRK